MEIKKINWFFPIFIISYLAVSFLASFLILLMRECGVAVPGWIDYVYGEFVIILLALIYMAVMKIDPLNDIPYRKIKPLDCLLSLVAGYCIVPLILLINAITMLFSTNYLNESTQTLTTYPFFAQIIILAVIPPLVEETVFRGLFFGTYRKSGFFKAAVTSGLIFGCFHLNINQFAYAFVIGIFFAYLLEATGSIWSSVIAHFAINTYSISMIQLSKMLGIATEESDAAAEAALETVEITAGVVITEILIFGMIICGFTYLSVLCVKKIAKRNNRLDLITIRKKKENVSSNVSESIDEEQKETQKVVTIPAAAGFVMCFVFMIMMEVLPKIA